MTEATPSTVLKPSQFAAIAPQLIAARLPVMLWGPPGIGKSQLWQQVCDAAGIECRAWMRTSQMDSIDVRGLPKLNGGDTMQWQMPDWWPTDPDTSGLLMFDEINSGAESVMAALYQVVLERRLGSRTLPDGWAVAAAGNRETDRSVVHRMPAALSRRFVHFDLTPDVNDWCKWALSSSAVVPELVAFIRFRPELLHDFDPKHRVDPNPRAWEKVSTLIGMQLPPELEMSAIAGTVGEGAAIECIAFLRVWRSLPSVDKILMDPLNAPVPDEPSTRFALCGALARRATKNNFQNVMDYTERAGTEFNWFVVNDATSRDPLLQATPAFVTWAAGHQELTQ